MKEYLPEIINLAGAIVVIVLTMTLNALKNYVNSKTTNETLIMAENKAFSFLASLVKSQQATFVDGLKQDLADGKLTKEEFFARTLILRDQTIKATKDALGEEVTAILNANYGDVTEYLKHKLESVVDDIKK